MSPHATPAPQLVDAGLRQAYWVELPTSRANVKIVRRIVGERLRSWHVSEEVCDDALLLTSELVTNVVIHARGTRFLCGFGLVADDRLRIEVHDQGSVRGGPIRRSAGPDCESGRGLYLVQELAADWGTVPSARTGGNMVWATLRTAAF